ncbi:hypothetical protein Hdeb2414_s0068g00769181 [Helianthus debilis subsp. tardiflorus]
MSNGYSCTINKKMLVILILRNKFYGDPSRILYPTMGSPLLGQILPIRDGISLTKKNRRFQFVSFLVTLKTG